MVEDKFELPTNFPQTEKAIWKSSEKFEPNKTPEPSYHSLNIAVLS